MKSILKKICLIVSLIPLYNQANTPSILLKKDTPSAKKNRLAAIKDLALSAASLTAAYVIHNSSDQHAAGSFVDKLPIVAIGIANYMNKTAPETKYIFLLTGAVLAKNSIQNFLP